MRILHIAHQQLRKYGATRVSWARKLELGLVKAGYDVHGFSDRDVAAFEAPLGLRPVGRRRANRRLLEMAEAVEPDLVIAGHCDVVRNQTLAELRRRHPGVIIVHCNNDPLFVPGNVARIERRAQVADAVFVSTGRRELERVFGDAGARLHHMPNPVDPTIERFDASTAPDLPVDLIFCGKSNAHTERLALVGWLRDALPAEIVFRTHGSFGNPGVWGLDYDRALAESKMGLNLNRQEGHHWYSSARMAQMGGNGLLVFTHADNGFDTLFPTESLVYWRTREELLARVLEFHEDDAKRRAWAANTRRFFHEALNATLYARYIVEAAMEQPFSHPYAWLA